MRNGEGADGVAAETGTAVIISAAQAALANIRIFTVDLSAGRLPKPAWRPGFQRSD
jgi:hypothetical protein